MRERKGIRRSSRCLEIVGPALRALLGYRGHVRSRRSTLAAVTLIVPLFGYAASAAGLLGGNPPPPAAELIDIWVSTPEAQDPKTYEQLKSISVGQKTRLFCRYGLDYNVETYPTLVTVPAWTAAMYLNGVLVGKEEHISHTRTGGESIWTYVEAWWTPPKSGDYEVSCVCDIGNALKESNEANNMASTTLHVSPLKAKADPSGPAVLVTPLAPVPRIKATDQPPGGGPAKAKQPRIPLIVSPPPKAKPRAGIPVINSPTSVPTRTSGRRLRLPTPTPTPASRRGARSS